MSIIVLSINNQDFWLSLEKINLNNQTNLKKDNDRLDRK